MYRKMHTDKLVPTTLACTLELYRLKNINRVQIYFRGASRKSSCTPIPHPQTT